MRSEKESNLPGVTHDLNNVLQTLLGVADLLSEDPRVAHLSPALTRSVRRAQDLTAILASHADQPAPLTEIVDHAIAFIEDSALALASGRRRPRIEFHRDIDAGLYLRRRRAWERVFVNLLMNAWRAMPKGGTILIRGNRGKNGIDIAVRDQGVGIAPRLLDTLFQAHVSGYASSGLGLHVVESIVQQDGGKVLARNRTDGPGAEVLIALPASAAIKPKSKVALAG